jgi:hypothetical protein
MDLNDHAASLGVSRFFYPFLTQGEQNLSHLPALEGN